MIRDVLRQCLDRQQAGEVLWFTGLLSKFGGSDRRGEELALFLDVQVEAQLVDDHLWVKEAAPLLYICRGTWVTFQATVYRYFREEGERRGSMDYGLRKPHHIIPLRNQERKVG